MGDIFYRPAAIELVSANIVYTNITPSLPSYGICGFHESGYVALAENPVNGDLRFTAYTWAGKYLDSFLLKGATYTEVTATYKDGVFYGSVVGSYAFGAVQGGFDFVNSYIIPEGKGFLLLFDNESLNYGCASVYQGIPCVLVGNPGNYSAVNYLNQSQFSLGRVFSHYITTNGNYEVDYATGKKSTNQSEINNLAIGDLSVGQQNLYLGTTAYRYPHLTFSSAIYNNKLLLLCYNRSGQPSTAVCMPMFIYDTGVVVDLIYRPMEYLTNFARNYSLPVMVKGAEHISSLPRNTNISFHL